MVSKTNYFTDMFPGSGSYWVQSTE